MHSSDTSPEAGEDAGEREFGRGGPGGSSLFPEATVDSRWWYWIAAVPVYFLLTLVLSLFAVGLFFLGFLFDLAGGGGLGTVGVTTLFVLGAVFVALPGLVLAVLFPVAMYVDAKAVRYASVGWDPDPVLYGLVAAVGVVVTNFVVSVPLAVYYLYRRHQAVGTP